MQFQNTIDGTELNSTANETIAVWPFQDTVKRE